MSDKIIDIKTLLKKHYVQLGDELQQIKLRMVFREAIEATIDLCAEKAKIQLKDNEYSAYYWEDYVKGVNKESILSIKKLIKYE